jgi:hypothetical protein
LQKDSTFPSSLSASPPIVSKHPMVIHPRQLKTKSDCFYHHYHSYLSGNVLSYL